MAEYHVRESGSWTPASPYGTWATAADDIEDIIAEVLVPGDTIYVESTYAVAYDSNKTLIFGADSGARLNPVEIISCGSSNTTYLRGAEIKANATYDLLLHGDGVIWRGFNFESGDDLTLYETNSFRLYDDCEFVDGSGS